MPRPSYYWRLYVLLVLGLVVVGSNAVLDFTNPSLELLTAGAPFNVTWSGASGTVTLTLQNGTASGGMFTVNTVAFGVKTPYILWSPYATTPTGTYVMRLDDTSGQSALSPEFVMLPSGTKTSATTGLQFTTEDFGGMQAGKAFNVTWEKPNGVGSVTLILQKGTANGIANVNVIATGITTPYINWTPLATTPSTQYVLKLVDDQGAIAYSQMFTMLAAGSSSSSSSSSVFVPQTHNPTSTSSIAVPMKASSTSSASPHSSSNAIKSPKTSLLSTSLTDFQSTSTTTITSVQTDTQAAPTQTSATSTSTSTSIPSPVPAAGLSTGAKAGIGIGSTIGGLAILSTLLLLYLRHYNIFISKKSSAPNSSSGQSIAYFGAPVTPMSRMGYEKGELGAGRGMMNGEYQAVPPMSLQPTLVEMGARGENNPTEMVGEGGGVHEISGRERWQGYTEDLRDLR